VEFQASSVIDARPDAVWAVLVDGPRWTDWDSAVVRVVNSIPLLDEAAKTAVRQWVFKPALTGNEAVAVWVAVPVRFTLH